MALTDKQARRACGVTQADLREALERATGIPVAAGTVSQWERGLKRPRHLAHREALLLAYRGFRRHLLVPEES